ncbi:MAG: aldehyde:ferredoxin oxidoreductase [Thermoproteota archaeon]|nr:MAG: aldehyde:ferredoxin oxidoreductase [Candidatus Korarchaeota archaeon]
MHIIMCSEGEIMKLKYKAYGGKILYVDLSKGKFEERPMTNELAEKYLGGTGLCARLLYDMIEPGINPLGPENVLMFAIGPLTGTMFPQASRHVFAAKSPLTEIWGESHAAGFIGPELKFAGYDAIVFLGRSEKPVYLLIYDGKPELRDARSIWGETTYRTEDLIRDEVGDPEVRVASIGPAGENLVRYAAIVNDHGRVAARSGMGAVMGSKRLKAIAVRGFNPIEVADPERYLEVMSESRRKMREHPYTPIRAKYGTTNLIELMHHIGRLPTYNMRQGVFEEYEKISGETLRRLYFVKPKADYACVQRCGRIVRVPSGPFACDYCKGPEYETLDSFGARCGNSNLEAIIHMNNLANEYGLDTVSTGATISWVMECYEEGLLTKEDLDGIEATWGNVDAMIQLIHKIAKREGVGDILAEGSWRAARKFGRGTEKFVMTVKKQEIAAQEPRAQKSMGLGIAVAERGADHLYSFPVLDEVGFEKEIKERYGEQYLPEIAEKQSPVYKWVMVKLNEDFAVLVESVGICKYGTMIPPALFYEEIKEALAVTNGFDFSTEELKLIGERIVNLHRAFNVREGIRRKDDSLPERLTKVPAPIGPAKGQVVELDMMLDHYYELRGWDKETGLPKKETLLRVGLQDVAEDLEARGIKLP